MAKLKDYFSWADINKIKSGYDINKLKDDPINALYKLGGAASFISAALGVTGIGEEFIRENVYDYGTGKWDPKRQQYVGGEEKKTGFLARNWQTLRKYATRPYSVGREFYKYINTPGYTYTDFRDKVFNASGAQNAGNPRKKENESDAEFYARRLLELTQAQKDQDDKDRNKPKPKDVKHKDFSAYGRTPTSMPNYVAGATTAAKVQGGFRNGGFGQNLTADMLARERMAKVMAELAGVKSQGTNIALRQSGIKVSRS